jgi:hypothetical protein
LTRRVSLVVGTNFVGDGADIPRENMGGVCRKPQPVESSAAGCVTVSGDCSWA